MGVFNPSINTTSGKYRPDVDGLRAIAVLPVLFFHAGFAGFQGGFVGVDIFFVISGFLITSLILPEAHEGRFSIITFYERRIRRIFPALFAVMLFTIAVGYCLMWPKAFREFGQSVLAATGFASNFLFSMQLGYFDSPAETRPLLHTWSLAVEEQFYIFFPIYLIIIVRFFPRAVKWITIVAAIISLGASIVLVAVKPTAAFYLAPTRAWELLLGALLAMGVFPEVKSGRLRTMLCLTGLIMIAMAIHGYSGTTPFPGLAALPPCVGTALVIYGGGGNPVSRYLSAPWLVFCGLISYSLYLWHWPFIVFAEIWLFRDLNNLEAAIVLAASFMLAVLSWRFIELPFRSNRQLFTRRRIFALAGAAMLATTVIGLSLHLTDGLPSRMPVVAQKLADESRDCSRFEDSCNYEDPALVRPDNLCRLGAVNSSRPDFVLWGDSHAKILAGAISRAAIQSGRSGFQITSAGCPPVVGIGRTDVRYGYCPKIARAAVRVISEPDVRQIIIAARWPLWTEGTHYKYEIGDEDQIYERNNTNTQLTSREVMRRGLIRTLDLLKPLKKKITIVAPIPEIGWDVPSVLAMESWHKREIHTEPRLEEFLKRNAFVLDLLRELRSQYQFDVVYPHEQLCDQEYCRVIRDNEPLYCDDDHLSNHGASYLIPAFHRALDFSAYAIARPRR